MAAAQKKESDREAALRRVAIVLSSLPAPIASRLLGTVDAESKRRLRNKMSNLVDVDPMERRLALQAFKGSVEQHRPAADSGTRPSATKSFSHAGDVEDEIIISRGQRSAPQSRPISRVVSPTEMPNQHTAHDSLSSSGAANDAPLAFLSEVDDTTLMNLLKGERPQTIALVLASIAPTQAALILPRLDARLQREALSRIGRLDGIPDAAVTDIADHLRERIRQQTKQLNDSSGNRALNAILAAMPKAESPAAPTPPTVERAATETRSPVESVGFSSSDVPAIDHLHRSLGGAPTLAEQSTNSTSVADGRSVHPESPNPADMPADPAPDIRQFETTNSDQAATFASTDAIHQHLIDLSPSALCQALGKVETRVALLTLCGLPSEIAESVLTILPRSHSKEVRRQLRSMGTLQLRDIDEAKEIVARASSPTPTASNTTQQTATTRVPLAA